MIEYRPLRAMVVYHWAIALMMLAVASALAVETLRAPWPTVREILPRIGFLGAFVLGVWFLAQQAWFVTFTRVRCTDHELLVSTPRKRETAVPYREIEAAHAFSLDAWPFGRLRLVRLLAGGRGVTLPLAKHPAKDHVFAWIAERARLLPTDDDWRNDTYYGRSDWVREADKSGIVALRRLRRGVLPTWALQALSLYGLLVLWAIGTGDIWIIWLLVGAMVVLGLGLWLGSRSDRRAA